MHECWVDPFDIQRGPLSSLPVIVTPYTLTRSDFSPLPFKEGNLISPLLHLWRPSTVVLFRSRTFWWKSCLRLILVGFIAVLWLFITGCGWRLIAHIHAMEQLTDSKDFTELKLRSKIWELSLKLSGLIKSTHNKNVKLHVSTSHLHLTQFSLVVIKTWKTD